MFIHTLDAIPRNWYTETKLRHKTSDWSMLVDSFKLTFIFVDDCMFIDQALAIIKTKKFDDVPLPVNNQHDWAIQIEHALDF